MENIKSQEKLINYINDNNIEAVKKYIEDKDFNISFSYNKAFHIACLVGNNDIFNLFFYDKRVDISDLGCYAFKEAAKSKNKYIIEKLIHSLDLQYASWCDGIAATIHKDINIALFIFGHSNFTYFRKKLQIKNNTSYQSINKKFINYKIYEF
jgi:hypothetical protein